MDQITGALIGIGLVLAAVFVPMAFFGGSTGVIYRQFSITIVAAMALSVLVALIFTPALCATMLKPVEKGHEHGETRAGSAGFFHWFNGMFKRGTDRYDARRRRRSSVRPLRFLAIYVAVVAVLGVLLVRMPTRLPARRGPGHRAGPGGAAGRRHAGAHDRGAEEGRAPLPGRTRRTRSKGCSRSPASASAAPARTWASASSS